jgi:hypothetical protein
MSEDRNPLLVPQPFHRHAFLAGGAGSRNASGAPVNSILLVLWKALLVVAVGTVLFGVITCWLCMCLVTLPYRIANRDEAGYVGRRAADRESLVALVLAIAALIEALQVKRSVDNAMARSSS